MGYPQANLSDLEIGWLTAIIEAEGSILLTTNKKQIHARVLLVNTDQAIVERYQNLLRKLDVRFWIQKKEPWRNRFGKRPCWEIVVFRHRSLIKLLDTILPNLASKIPEAKLVRQFATQRAERLNQQDADGRTSFRNRRNGDRLYNASDWALLSSFRELRESPREQRPSIPI